MNNQFRTSDDNLYYIDALGIVTQKYPIDFKYNKAYINNYNSAKYRKDSVRLNALRLSTVVQQYGKIPNTILDYGYGNGAFLRAALQKVKYCDGYDITPIEPPIGVKKISNFNTIYDCVTFWDSLEHIKELNFIKYLHTKSIAVSLPYCKDISEFKSFDKWLKWFDGWKHRKPNEHIHHFTPIALTKFFKVMGYDMQLVCNIEDEIRKPEKKGKNILTGFFVKNL